MIATILVLHNVYSARLPCKLCDSTLKTGDIGKIIEKQAQIFWDIVQLMPKSEYDKNQIKAP